MMRTLALILLLLVWQPAAAQVPPKPPCDPPSSYTYKTTNAGRIFLDSHEVFYWFCTGKFEVTYHGFIWENGTAVTHVPTSLGTAWKAVTSDWDDPKWAEPMALARMTIVPHLETMPAPAYVVAPTGTAATRPTYPFTLGAPALNATNGTRATKASGTVAVGSACNCVSRVAGSTIYCAVPSAASGIHVAACVRKP